MEIRICDEGATCRVIFTARIKAAVVMLHKLQKQSFISSSPRDRHDGFEQRARART